MSSCLTAFLLYVQVLALGGAKNHLVALPDCDPDMAAQDIVASFAGCSGQRCMAASVLIPVGNTGELLAKVRKGTPRLVSHWCLPQLLALGLLEVIGVWLECVEQDDCVVR